MNKILRNLLFDGVDGYIEELKVELATTEDSSRKQEIIKEPRPRTGNADGAGSI